MHGFLHVPSMQAARWTLLTKMDTPATLLALVSTKDVTMVTQFLSQGEEPGQCFLDMSREGKLSVIEV